jgi:hypothetical protein
MKKIILIIFLCISILTSYIHITYSDSQIFKVCKKGYKRISNNVCKKIKIPNNAEITYGNNWKCKKGYLISDNKKFCNKVNVPKNAHFNSRSSVGWTCNKEYKPSGKKCIKVELPENAYFTYDGQWKCDYGYKRFKEKCIEN